MMASEDRPNDRSFGNLLSELSKDIATLFRKEIELARAETSEKVTQSMVAIGSIAGGAILALAALIVLLQALVIAITELGVPPALSSLIVGVVVAAVAYGLIHKGTSDLKAGSLAPTRTLGSLKRDAQVAKEQVQ
jgi:Putative Actinobacterial Holin-X, holin superfamily III